MCCVRQLENEAAKLKEKQHLRVLHFNWSFGGSFNVSDVFDDESSWEGFQPHPNLKELRLFGYLGSRLTSWANPPPGNLFFFFFFFFFGSEEKMRWLLL
jgi:hypothetical protein